MRALYAIIIFAVIWMAFFFIFSAPTFSRSKLDLKWISPDSNDVESIDFPFEKRERGPVEFNMLAEFSKDEITLDSMVIPGASANSVNVLLNGERIASVAFPPDINETDQLLLSKIVSIDPAEIKEENSLIVNYQSRDRLLVYSPPYLGSMERIKPSMDILAFLGKDIYLIAFGMGVLLSVILILLSKHVQEKKITYIAIGIATLFNSFGCVLYTAERIFSTRFDFFLTALKSIAFVLFNLMLLIGIEAYYDKKRLNLSKKLLIPNIIACFLIYLGLDVAQYVINYMNLAAMIFISFNKKSYEFVFPVTILSATSIYLLVAPVSGEFVPLPIYASSSLAIIISFGIVMVRDFQKTYKELQNTSNELYASYEELTAMNEELESSYRELDRKVVERTTRLNDITASLRTLLDNTDEGFLTFSKDLLIDPEYSKECERIFNGSITGRSFSALIADGDVEIKEFLDKIFPKILRGARDEDDNDFEIEMYLSLLPEEIIRNDRTISLDYRIIESPTKEKQIMVVMRDISEKIELQNEIEHERNILKMVIKVIKSREDYLELLRDYREFFINGINQILNSHLSSEEKSSEIFRITHTFKGNFANFDSINSVRALHEFESIIEEDRKRLNGMEQMELKRYFDSFSPLNWIEDDLTIIKKTVGEDFFQTDEKLLVEPERILDLENRVAEGEMGEEGRNFLIHLKRLRYRSFKDMIGYYRKYTQRLAQKTNKLVNPVQINGDDATLDKDLYKPLIRSFTHLFRNSIFHGIESPEERVKKGKSEYGNITVNIKNEDKTIFMDICDDGKGIDVEQVVNKAVELKRLTPEEIDKMDDFEKINLIFKDRISTSEVVTDISGRGVGLSALKNELERFGGDINITTEKDRFTCFRIQLPVKETHELPEIPLEKIRQLIEEEAKKYFDSLNVKILEIEEDSSYDRISLKKFSSFIRLSGAVYATTLLSSDNNLARFLAAKLLMKETTERISQDDMIDGVSETCNIFVGNAMRDVSKASAVVSISSPVSLNCSKGAINYPDKKNYSCRIKTDKGTLGFFVIEK